MNESDIQDATLIIRFGSDEQLKSHRPLLEGTLGVVDGEGKHAEHKVYLVEENNVHDSTAVMLKVDSSPGEPVERLSKPQPSSLGEGIHLRIDSKGNLQGLLFSQIYDLPDDVASFQGDYPRWGIGTMIGLSLEYVGQSIIVDNQIDGVELSRMQRVPGSRSDEETI